MEADRGGATGGPILDDPGFLRALIENTSEGLLTIDTESRILFANPAIEEILGYRPDELVGSSKMEIIPERLRPVHGKALQQYIETGEKHVDWSGDELPALHRDGHEVPVSVSLREHEYNGDRLFTGIFTDITRRKRCEQRLQEQNQDLEEFAHVLSHDIRGPLSAAQGYVELCREEHETDELQQIAVVLSRIEQIVDDTTTNGPPGRRERRAGSDAAL